MRVGVSAQPVYSCERAPTACWKRFASIAMLALVPMAHTERQPDTHKHTHTHTHLVAGKDTQLANLARVRHVLPLGEVTRGLRAARAVLRGHVVAAQPRHTGPRESFRRGLALPRANQKLRGVAENRNPAVVHIVSARVGGDGEAARLLPACARVTPRERLARLRQVEVLGRPARDLVAVVGRAVCVPRAAGCRGDGLATRVRDTRARARTRKRLTSLGGVEVRRVPAWDGVARVPRATRCWGDEPAACAGHTGSC